MGLEAVRMTSDDNFNAIPDMAFSARPLFTLKYLLASKVDQMLGQVRPAPVIHLQEKYIPVEVSRLRA